MLSAISKIIKWDLILKLTPRPKLFTVAILGCLYAVFLNRPESDHFRANQGISPHFYLISALLFLRTVIPSSQVFKTPWQLRDQLVQVQSRIPEVIHFFQLLAARLIIRFFYQGCEFALFLIISHIFLDFPVLTFLQPHVLYSIVATFFAYAGLGMIISSLCMLHRSFSGLHNFVMVCSILFGGVFVPLNHISESGILISKMLPISFSLPIIRQAITHNQHDYSTSLLPLTLITLLYTAGGFVLLHLALRYASHRDNDVFTVSKN